MSCGFYSPPYSLSSCLSDSQKATIQRYRRWCKNGFQTTWRSLATSNSGHDMTGFHLDTIFSWPTGLHKVLTRYSRQKRSTRWRTPVNGADVRVTNEPGTYCAESSPMSSCSEG
ncbi:hypothetical protein C8Q80DRAFT_778035 [Daedaleopsis nitida]|nr:hypothetical protein C8Q80DRAFT_778035 [Daedaleopsis nitida]